MFLFLATEQLESSYFCLEGVGHQVALHEVCATTANYMQALFRLTHHLHLEHHDCTTLHWSLLWCPCWYQGWLWHYDMVIFPPKCLWLPTCCLDMSAEILVPILSICSLYTLHYTLCTLHYAYCTIHITLCTLRCA